LESSAFTEKGDHRIPKRIVAILEIEGTAATKADRLRVLDEQLEYLRGQVLRELEQIPIIPAEKDPGVKISVELAEAMVAVRSAFNQPGRSPEVFARDWPSFSKALDRLFFFMTTSDRNTLGL